MGESHLDYFLLSARQAPTMLSHEDEHCKTYITMWRSSPSGYISDDNDTLVPYVSFARCPKDDIFDFSYFELHRDPRFYTGVHLVHQNKLGHHYMGLADNFEIPTYLNKTQHTLNCWGKLQGEFVEFVELAVSLFALNDVKTWSVNFGDGRYLTEITGIDQLYDFIFRWTLCIQMGWSIVLPDVTSSFDANIMQCSEFTLDIHCGILSDDNDQVSLVVMKDNEFAFLLHGRIVMKLEDAENPIADDCIDYGYLQWCLLLPLFGRLQIPNNTEELGFAVGFSKPSQLASTGLDIFVDHVRIWIEHILNSRTPNTQTIKLGNLPANITFVSTFTIGNTIDWIFHVYKLQTRVLIHIVDMDLWVTQANFLDWVQEFSPNVLTFQQKTAADINPTTMCDFHTISGILHSVVDNHINAIMLAHRWLVNVIGMPEELRSFIVNMI